VNFCPHINLASRFWKVRVRDKDIHETPYQTQDALMGWVAMPFRLCIAQATFQRMMNDILRDFLHKIVIVSLDDVCVFRIKMLALASRFLVLMYKVAICHPST
jgi:hypothetical protein